MTFAAQFFRFGLAIITCAGFCACASTSTSPTKESGLTSADKAKHDFLISDTADKFASVSAGEAKDCQHFALVKTMVGFRGKIDTKTILSGPSRADRQAAQDVKEVWATVYERKSDAEKAAAVESREARVEARKNGALEKLSEEKCVYPMLEDLGYEVSGTSE